LNGALRRTVSEPLAKEMVESQQHSLDAMTNLLNSLLDISRLDAGAVTPVIEDFPVQRLIERHAAECARQARHKGLSCKTVADVSTIRSDPNLLGEIIQNLIANAIRYTEQGQVTLSCRDLGRRLSIDVSDTGIGIAPEHIDEIFHEFHQLRTPTTQNEGFGLGLAIVRRLADLLGHEIAVTSTPGEGSRFSVVVPTVVQPPASPAVREAAEFPVAPADGVIILVEDDRRVARAWTMLLQAEGYRVVLAETAGEAGSVAGNLDAAPDLIISDFHLRDGSNGIEAATAIRRTFDRDLPAFIVSGDTSGVVNEAKRLSNSVLLRKPVRTDELLAMVQRTIAGGQVPDS
jgi:CheY-like chemotaxis protein/two-component sensor histidine kinase